MQKFGWAGFTGRKCEVKFKNFKAQFRKIKTRMHQTKREGNFQWPFYDIFDDLFQKDAAINPDHVEKVGVGVNRLRRRFVINYICLY